MNAMPIWRRLLLQATSIAAFLARDSDGSRIEIKTAIMPMTTRSSTRVKPFDFDDVCVRRNMDVLLEKLRAAKPEHRLASERCR